MIDDQSSERYISNLFGAFDQAVLKRINATEDGAHERLLIAFNDVSPKTPEEVAIWNELTSPENREALRKYIASFTDPHDYAKRLDAALIADSDRRAAARADRADEGPSDGRKL